MKGENSAWVFAEPFSFHTSRSLGSGVNHCSGLRVYCKNKKRTQYYTPTNNNLLANLEKNVWLFCLKTGCLNNNIFLWCLSWHIDNILRVFSSADLRPWQQCGTFGKVQSVMRIIHLCSSAILMLQPNSSSVWYFFIWSIWTGKPPKAECWCGYFLLFFI